MPSSGSLSNHTLWVRFAGRHWDALLASVLASCFLYFLMRHSGVGISPDSVEYISSAETMRRHGRLTDFTGQALVLFPAGYPLFLSAILLVTGMEVLQFAPVLNMLLLSGVLFLTSIIIDGHEKTSRWYKFLFLLALVPSRCLLQAYSMLWSETLFIFLALLFITRLRVYLCTHNRRALLWMAVIAALALDVRYAGITLLATGSIVILADAETAWRKRFSHLAIFNAIGISLLAINLIRNSRVSHSYTGVREAAERGLSDNLLGVGNTLGQWLPFMNGHAKAGAALFVTLLTLSLCIVVYRVLQQQFFRSYETVVAVFFGVYSVFIVVLATVSRFEELNSRLLLPVYIPLLLIGTSWIIPLLHKTARPGRILLILSALTVYAGFHWNQYQQNAEAWVGIGDSGVPGYSEDDWVYSETVQYIKKHKQEIGTRVFANANDAIYFLTGIPAIALPHKDIPSEIEAFLKVPSFYVVMFNDGDNPDLISIDTILRHKILLHRQSFSDGAVYYFSNP